MFRGDFIYDLSGGDYQIFLSFISISVIKKPDRQ